MWIGKVNYIRNMSSWHPGFKTIETQTFSKPKQLGMGVGSGPVGAWEFSFEIYRQLF